MHNARGLKTNLKISLQDENCLGSFRHWKILVVDMIALRGPISKGLWFHGMKSPKGIFWDQYFTLSVADKKLQLVVKLN